MRRILAEVLTLSLLIGMGFPARGEIETDKAGKNLVVRFHSKEPDSLTISQVEADFRQAVSEAQRLRCTNISLYDTEGDPFLFVLGKDKINDVESQVVRLKEYIESLKSEEYIKEKVGTKKKYIHGPKYRTETYHNGKLTDIYETDWKNGWFAPKTSKHTGPSGVYTTKTFYVEEEWEDVDVYQTTETIRREGIENFIRKVYFHY